MRYKTRALVVFICLILTFIEGYSQGIVTSFFSSQQVDYLGYETDVNLSEMSDYIIHIEGEEDITNRLSNALKNGGTIKISGGIGLISRPLVITKDNTHLIIDDGTTLKWTHPTYGVIIRTVYVNDKKTILNNISIEGGIWEMGGADYKRGSNPAMMIVGVTNLRVSNITMYDPLKFFFGFGCIDGFDISNITMILRNTSILGKDGLHFAGGVRNGVVSNIRGNTTDDLVALNFGGDIVGDGGENGHGDMMAVGDSYNVTVKNIYSDDAMEAIRLLADDTYKCTDIIVDGVYGTVKKHSCISISGWMYEGHTAKFGDITFSNIHIQTSNTTKKDSEAWHTPIILVGNHWNGIVPCFINCLSINGCVVTQSEGMIQTPVRILGNTTIESLIIDGLIVNSMGDVNLGGRSVIDIGYPGQNSKISNLKITNCYIKKTTIPFKSLINIETDESVIEKAIIVNNCVGTVLPKKSRVFKIKNNIRL